MRHRGLDRQISRCECVGVLMTFLDRTDLELFTFRVNSLSQREFVFHIRTQSDTSKCNSRMRRIHGCKKSPAAHLVSPLFIFKWAYFNHLVIYFFSKMQRNSPGTFYLHFKVDVYRGQPWPFPLLCFNELRSLWCKNVLISAAPVTNSQKWLISGKTVPRYWGLSWTKGSINTSLWLHNQPWKSKWTLLGNITSTVSTDL